MKTSLFQIKDLHRAVVHATDGEIGHVEEFLFDDEHWTIRYLVVDTGNWLKSRKVLISPMALGDLDSDKHGIQVNLTREKIENSLSVETDQPVSRQWEEEYSDYYTWPYYWNGVREWGGYGYAGMLINQTIPSLTEGETQEIKAFERAHNHDDFHLRSTKEVTGYGISATDGHLGHITDFLVNAETWRVRYLMVDTGDWLPGKKVLLPPHCLGPVHWPGKTVDVSLTRAQVQNAPEWTELGGTELEWSEGELDKYYALHPFQRVASAENNSEKAQL